MFIDDKTRVKQMIDAAEEATGFAEKRSLDDVREDRSLSLLLVKCLEIAGEAASRISRNCRDAHPEIPWKALQRAKELARPRLLRHRC